jgi:ABC-2 type transport system permease protein
MPDGLLSATGGSLGAAMITIDETIPSGYGPVRSRRQALAHQARVLRVIARIEFKLKYADSALGYFWSVAKPLALFSVLYVVFGRFFKLNAGLKHYPLYLLTGIVLWTFFIDATSLTLNSMVARGSLLRKLAFPRLVVPMSTTLTAGITFCVNLIVIAVFVAANRITPHLSWFLLIPLLLELYLFTLGVGLILATLFVRFRDIGQVWELLGQLLFYASPIIIPVSFLPPWFRPISFLNPFVQIMQDVRRSLISDMPVTTATSVFGGHVGHLLPIALALATFVAGILFFRRESPWFAERV